MGKHVSEEEEIRLNFVMEPTGLTCLINERKMREMNMVLLRNLEITEKMKRYSWLNTAPDDLFEIEQRINDRIKGIILSKLDICVALAKIKSNALYRQLGIPSFRKYLQEERINIHYHTAHEYAKIGEVWIEYQSQLKRIDFKEENGLKKLLLLDHALNTLSEEKKELVFKKLINSSYREFNKFVNNASESARADSEDRATLKNKAFKFALEMEGECIVLLPTGKEIIWFDTDIESLFSSSQLLGDFKRHIMKAAEDFFVDAYTCCHHRPSGGL